MAAHSILFLLLNQVNDFLKLADAGKTLRPQADNLLELRDQMLLSDADRVCQVSNRQELRRVLQLMHRESNQPVALERAPGLTQ